MCSFPVTVDEQVSSQPGHMKFSSSQMPADWQ